MVKALDPHRIDIRRLAEGGAELEGEVRLDGLPRLREEAPTADPSTPITWKASAALAVLAGRASRPWLRLAVETAIPLTCQRCLQPVEVPLTLERSFRFEATEDAAAAEDELSDEEDVLVESPRFDLLELIEDELVMALPVVPRHEVCPQPVSLSVEDPAFGQALDARPNPFAALDKLRKRSGGDTGL